MKEYAIYCICNNGKPYFVKPYDNFFEARQSLGFMIEGCKKNRKPYYVDNDFFENEFPYMVDSGMYYSIYEREVTEWEKVFTETKKKNNIINFNNYIDIS